MTEKKFAAEQSNSAAGKVTKALVIGVMLLLLTSGGLAFYLYHRLAG